MLARCHEGPGGYVPASIEIVGSCKAIQGVKGNGWNFFVGIT